MKHKQLHLSAYIVRDDQRREFKQIFCRRILIGLFPHLDLNCQGNDHSYYK